MSPAYARPAMALARTRLTRAAVPSVAAAAATVATTVAEATTTSPSPKPDTPALAVVNGHHISPLAPGLLPAAALARAGAAVYDPGLAHTAACTSAITHIDGARGHLRHRGHPIEALVAARVGFLQVAFLLSYGALPSARQLKAFRAAVLGGGAVVVPERVRRVVEAFGEGAHPMGVLVAALAAMGTVEAEMEGGGRYKGEAERDRALVLALGVMPALAAGVLRQCAGVKPAFLEAQVGAEVQSEEGYAERFMQLAGIGRGEGEAMERRRRLFARALEQLLVLHADHEQNCSTSAVRALSSAGADVFTAVSGGAGALSGPLHGGATEAVVRMLERIGTVARVKPFLEGVKRREERLMGFGHRVYREYDPRARVIRGVAKEVAKEVGGGEELVAVAAALEEAALADEYFVSRKLFPNCDFYSGFVYRAMGVPAEGFTVVFALARMAGWMAQWREFLDDPDRRISRPRQRYVGVAGPVEVAPVAEREDAPGGPGGKVMARL